MSAPAEAYDAIVLAGGSARRMGGADKPGLVVGDLTLLDRVLMAVSGATTTVVVGPERSTMRTVRWVVEEPQGGGPVAALAAALPFVTSPVVVLLASDLPFLDAETVDRLRMAIGAKDGALLVDGDGRDQLLVGAWRTVQLRDAVPPTEQGARLVDVVGRLDAVRVSVPPDRPAWFDCDTAADLTAARSRL